MNRRGMLLASETLKMILGIISIGFLVFLLTSLYFANVDSKNLVDAKATIERVSQVAERVGSGEISFETINAVSPAGWNFFSFTEAETKPNSCANQNCLCICDEVWSEFGGFFGERQVNECGENGACIIISNLKKFETFEIGGADDSTDIEIRKQGESIEVIQK